jgi:prephenate dehydrogenase
MTLKITIVGLGQIGGSIGLALTEKKEAFYRIGHDIDLGTARRAEKAGAVDKIAINLVSAVKESDLIILAIPIDQIRDTLEVIAPNLKDGAIVMDTAPVKEIVSNWTSELLPQDRFYIGMTPVLNPTHLHSFDTGFSAARPDLFRNGLMAVVSPPHNSSEAVQLASDVTRLLGAEPFFVDLLEIDGLMAAVHTLPQIIAAALVEATVNQPGWREARKVAGRFYAGVTSPVQQASEIRSLSASTIYNKPNVLRVIDNMVTTLQSFRDEIERDDKDQLETRLDQAIEGRTKWWEQRQSTNWYPQSVNLDEIPTPREMLGRFIGLGKKPKTRK